MKTIYFIRAANGTGPIKIGCTNDLQVRFGQLMRQLKQPICILAFASGDFRDEAALHRKFANLREHGEWFRPGQELLDYIHSTVDKRVLPATKEIAARHKIAERYFGGETLCEIGQSVGLSRERVRQLLRSQDGIPLSVKRERANRKLDEMSAA
jgi:hypothetical protein